MISQGLSDTTCPGLGLKAWALINGASGTIIKSSNVTSMVRVVAGQYNITMTNPLQSVNAVINTVPRTTGESSDVLSVNTFRVMLGGIDRVIYAAIYE